MCVGLSERVRIGRYDSVVSPDGTAVEFEYESESE